MLLKNKTIYKKSDTMTNLTQLILIFEEKYDAKWTDNIQYSYIHESSEIDFIIPLESIPSLLADISKIKTMSMFETNKTIIKCIYEEGKYYISININTIKRLLKNDIYKQNFINGEKKWLKSTITPTFGFAKE